MTEEWPEGRLAGQQPAIQAQLSVRDGLSAIAFYQEAFGAVEQHRAGGTDDNRAIVSQLSVGDAWFWVADESPAHGNFSPESLGGGTVRMLLIADDPAEMIMRAEAAGGRVVYPVSEAHGWLLGRIEDPFGHHWEIGRPLREWPPPSA